MTALSHEEKAARIRELNDAFRTTLSGGSVLLSAGVYELPDMVKAAAIRKVVTFDEFTEDNDPYGEHERSDAAKRKQTTGRTDDGLPVHSFRSLLADLATYCRIQEVRLRRSTPLQSAKLG